MDPLPALHRSVARAARPKATRRLVLDRAHRIPAQLRPLVPALRARAAVRCHHWRRASAPPRAVSPPRPQRAVRRWPLPRADQLHRPAASRPRAGSKTNPCRMQRATRRLRAADPHLPAPASRTSRSCRADAHSVAARPAGLANQATPRNRVAATARRRVALANRWRDVPLRCDRSAPPASQLTWVDRARSHRNSDSRRAALQRALRRARARQPK
jgi:hypothetical protein